ncbi:MAG: riboflavin biosynthesis protein RibF [Oscillospiraceae bacterium]
MQEVYDMSWCNTENTAVALGYFDGVHVAHQYLINMMGDYAVKNNLKKAVFTFTKSIKLGHKGKDILSLPQKLLCMRELGIDLFYSPDFSDFSQLTPEEFVLDVLINSMGAKAVFCGENFFFGKNRSGDVSVLQRLCSEYGIAFIKAPTLNQDGEVVSSSAIRLALENGNIEKANKMLGRPYSIDFCVVHGKKLGRTIGTPTINQIYPANMCYPKEGVYLSCTTVDEKKYPSATGFGTRPTVNGVGLTSETYIKGFDGDLYYRNIKVEFFAYLFAPQKFDDLSQLSAMILLSADKAEEYLKENALI